MSELKEQIALMTWCEYMTPQMPELALLFAIPNGGRRDPKEAVNFKRSGVKAGVPDLFLPVPKDKYHGLFIELKTLTGKVSKAQEQWHQALREQGYMVAVAKGYEGAVWILEQYLTM